jgi:ABC-type methionine transport system ATPase subunit
MDTVRSVADSVGRLDRGAIVEQGNLLELLRSPDSQLGADLRPAHTLAATDDGQARWQVTYLSAQVPSDWLHILSERLGSSVALLGANIETLNGALYGEATIGISGATEEKVLKAVDGLHLAARLVGLVHPDRAYLNPTVEELEVAS